VPIVLEFWPYGLARAGVSARAFVDSIATHFTGFYDLADDLPVRQPTGEASRLFARYAHYKAFTDLLLVGDAPGSSGSP
jgi:hypothetical protein